MSKYTLGNYVVKNWNDWDRVPRDPVLIGNAIMVAVGATTTSIAVIYAVGVLAISAVTSFALRALAPKLPSQRKGQLVNSREGTAPAAFIYGQVRVGGNVTFIAAEDGSGGEPNQYMHQILVLAAHEVEEIGDIYLNDQVANFDTTAGNEDFVLTAGSGADETDWKSKVRITKYDGSQVAVSTELQGLTNSNFVGRNIAFLHIRYDYDQDVFADGIPLVTALVKGKKVYDPRTGTTAWSDNAALCIRDFLVSDYGLNDSAIDDVYFSAAANDCDDLITLSAGGSEKRYTVNGVVYADETIDTVLGDMTSACNGTLFWGVGAWKLKVGVYTSPVKDFDLSDLRGPISLDTRTSIRDSFNTVRGTFVNKDNGYITEDFEQITSATFKTEDGGEELALDLQLPYTTSFASAARLAKQTLYRSREQMTFSADFGLEALSVEVGDIVTFTNSRYGWDQKEFEVAGWLVSPNQDAGDLRVTLTLRETSSAAFDWNAEENEIISNNTTLPDYTAGLTIFNLSAGGGGNTQGDGTFINSALLSWDAAGNSFVERYEVQWRRTSDSTYASTFTSDNSIEITPLIDGIEYTFRVRAITANGFRGPFASVTLTAGGDTTAPNAPTNLTAVGGYKYITISCDLPANPDFSHIEVYEDTDNTFSGAVYIGQTAGNSFVRSGLPNDATRYYWLRSVDYSGNASAFAGPVSGTSSLIEGADLTQTLLDTIEQAGVQAVNSLPASGDYDGQIVFLLTNFTLYRWDAGSSSWSDQLFTAIADGSITETKISNDSISTPKLQANSVQAAKIATGAITTDKIAAGAIVANKIAAGQITADKLSSNELSSHYATIGVFQTAPSGARLRIEDDKITVYDSSGVVRVKIGNLA